MLFAAGFMWKAGIAASLLSLGAIDFGLIVDGAVIIVENCVRRIDRAHGAPRLPLVRDASVEVLRPALFGGVIIMIVFLPILTLAGPEGKLFRPMALTMMAALAGSIVLSVTLVPVLASSFLRGQAERGDPRLVRVAERLYAPVLRRSLRHSTLTLTLAFMLVVATGFIATRMGREFLPKLGEGAIVASSVRLAGVSVDEAASYNTRIENLLLESFPDEIDKIWTRLGTAEVATDPMGIELSDVFMALKPRSEWKRARTQAELVAAMDEMLRILPGMNFSFTQPIEMRMNELTAGIRSDLGIKIYGDDFAMLTQISDDIQRVLLTVDGAADVSGEQITGQPLLRVAIATEAIARLGVPARNVLNVVEAVGGKDAGEIREGQRRFPLVVRLPERSREDPAALAATLIPTAGGPVVPLSSVTILEETEGPSTITREWGRRRIVVQCNVRGRDVGSFVEDARRRIASEVDVPAGYTVDWGGQFEGLQRANRRMMFAIPAALALIFILLYLALREIRDVLIVATAIPFSTIGGVLALAIRGMPFTVSAAIGFIALSGVAILNGLVLVTFVQQRSRGGLSINDAVREACHARLRPVLMTALVAAVGFVPMALNTSVGAEVQRPLATVVIGGIVSSMVLTLVVLPSLYARLARGRPSWNPAAH
jgi:cobalt-zinc-cadmium resistance protein CzcA